MKDKIKLGIYILNMVVLKEDDLIFQFQCFSYNDNNRIVTYQILSRCKVVNLLVYSVFKYKNLISGLFILNRNKCISKICMCNIFIEIPLKLNNL